jgi:hypothetical protein
MSALILARHEAAIEQAAVAIVAGAEQAPHGTYLITSGWLEENWAGVAA